MHFHVAEKEGENHPYYLAVCRLQGEGEGQAWLLAVGLGTRKQLLAVLSFLRSVRMKDCTGTKLY